MGYLIGMSDSYYRITEKELLDDYLKAVGHLTIDENSILRRQAAELSANQSGTIKKDLEEFRFSADVIASLSDEIQRLQDEIESYYYARRDEIFEEKEQEI